MRYGSPRSRSRTSFSQLIRPALFILYCGARTSLSPGRCAPDRRTFHLLLRLSPGWIETTTGRESLTHPARALRLAERSFVTRLISAIHFIHYGAQTCHPCPRRMRSGSSRTFDSRSRLPPGRIERLPDKNPSPARLVRFRLAALSLRSLA